MDQLKDFLRQCVKYRFWIAFGISLLLPMIGYFVGAGTINAETTKQRGRDQGGQDRDRQVHRARASSTTSISRSAAAKKEVLTKDVNATWRKLFAIQEPLLKWPPRSSRTVPQVGPQVPRGRRPRTRSSRRSSTTPIAYPEFVSKIYKTSTPSTSRTAPGSSSPPTTTVLLRPAPFSPGQPARPEQGLGRAGAALGRHRPARRRRQGQRRASRQGLGRRDRQADQRCSRSAPRPPRTRSRWPRARRSSRPTRSSPDGAAARGRRPAAGPRRPPAAR